MLKITAYAQRLIDDLEKVNYIDRVKTSQINWIGRSTGAEVDFATTAGDTPDRLYHPPGYTVWRYPYGYFTGASLYCKMGGQDFQFGQDQRISKRKRQKNLILNARNW